MPIPFLEVSHYLKFTLPASKVAYNFLKQKTATSSTSLVTHFTETKERGRRLRAPTWISQSNSSKLLFIEESPR